MSLKLFELSELAEAVYQDLENGNPPDPAKVNLFIQQGPLAIEGWVDAIEALEGDADVIDLKIKALQIRKEARTSRSSNMKKFLSEVLDAHFSGKIKTALVTVWNQDSSSYEFEVPEDSTYWIPQPKKLDKKALISAQKEHTLDPQVKVTESKTRSVRIKR